MVLDFLIGLSIPIGIASLFAGLRSMVFRAVFRRARRLPRGHLESWDTGRRPRARRRNPSDRDRKPNF